MRIVSTKVEWRERGKMSREWEVRGGKGEEQSETNNV